MKRRDFSKLTIASAFIGLTPLEILSASTNNKDQLKISLAQWSLNKAIKSGELSPLDFAKKARSFDIDAIEYVSGLYTNHTDTLKKISMQKLSKELLKRSDDYGIDNVLIMIDSQGSLASSNKKERLKAIDNHKKWIDFSYEIGCETMRVNLSGETKLDRWTENSIKSLTELSDYNKNINVVVENHGGLSSNGKYLSNVMSKVNIDNCGTLPDFGNFCIDGSPRACNEWYDIYKGVEELMPYAHAVSAKSYDFDDSGNETKIDYSKMIDIVKKAGYKGYIGIEYEGSRMSEDDGIIATKKLLEKLI
ncbi:MAG: sugar phosphate isomerase/epimerase [Cryomorphaceae bacterium]|nr:MAG: sugar phosphate isomerase/epimerase [Cryomorphaceae bacterium]